MIDTQIRSNNNLHTRREQMNTSKGLYTVLSNDIQLVTDFPHYIHSLL